MHRRPHVFHRVLLPVVMALCTSLPVQAESLAEVNALYQAKKYPDALAGADAFLRHTPRDAHMRFVKGLILTDMGKRSEAIAVFNALTVDFPSMPEPYNNLAVLYASSGEHDNARIALEKSIQANPGYATAYENLADIHLMLASQRYDALLQQNPDNTQVRIKYLLVRSALDNPGESIPIAGATKPNPAKAALLPILQGKLPTGDAAGVEAAASNSERDAVLAVVSNWAEAWSKRDLQRYLGMYAASFRVPNGDTRAAWEEQRRSRIVKPDSIDVRVEAPEVTVKGDVATVRFLQHYVSGKIKSSERKTLSMQKVDGQWKIVQERRA